MKNFLKDYYKNYPHLIILVLATVLISININKPFFGHHDFNASFFSQIGKNLITYSPLDTKLGNLSGSGPLNPENFDYFVHNVPLYSWILALSFLIFGVGEWQARIVSILAIILASIVIYKISLKLFDRLTANLSILFFFLSAMILYFSSSVFPEPTAMLFSLLTFYFYVKWIKNGESKSFYYLMTFLFLALLTVWSSYFLPPYLVFHYLILKKGKNLTKILPIILLPIVTITAHLVHTFILTGDLFIVSFVSVLLQRINPASDEILKFTIFEFIRREQSLVFAYYSKVTIVLVIGWFLRIIYKLYKREKQENSQALLVLFFWGASYPLFFIQAAYIHDYFLIYLAPFIAIAAGHFLSEFVKKFTSKKNYFALAYIWPFALPLIQFFMIKDFALALINSNASREGYYLGKILNNATSYEDKILVLSGQFGAHFSVFTDFYANRQIRYADFTCETFNYTQPDLNYEYIVYIYKRQDTPLCALKTLKGKYTSVSSDQFEIFKIKNE